MTARFLLVLTLAMQPLLAELRIGIIGDQTGTTDLGEAYRTLEQGIEKLRQDGRFDVFLHTGDLLESSRSEEQIRRDFQRASELLDRLPAPWHLTPGDHDVNPLPAADLADRSRQELFRRLYSRRQPGLGEHLAYSFDLKGYHFVALNSLEHLGTDPRWGDVFRAALSRPQQDWLEADLKHHRRSKGIIVFTHQPLWYNWGSWDAVHRLLSRYPVRAVVAGHFHYSQQDALLDGIQYLVVGATGGRIKDASIQAGGVQAVYELGIRGREVELTVVPLNGEEPFHAPSRHDMDRVQAVDNTLDLLSGFQAANTVFWEGGKPVAACGSSTPARLELRQIGNAVDLPLLVELGVESEEVQVTASRFAPGVCLNEAGPFKCRLKPGTNIGLSNTSSVELDSFAPLSVWEATLAAQPEPDAPDKIRLSVRIGFIGQNGEPMHLRRSVELGIRPCRPR